MKTGVDPEIKAGTLKNKNPLMSIYYVILTKPS